MDTQDEIVITSPLVAKTSIGSTITTPVSSPKLSDSHVISGVLSVEVSGTSRKLQREDDFSLMVSQHELKVTLKQFLKTWSIQPT